MSRTHEIGAGRSVRVPQFPEWNAWRAETGKRPLPRHMSYEFERIAYRDPIMGNPNVEEAFAFEWMSRNHPRSNGGCNYGLGILVDLVAIKLGRHGHPFYEETPRWPLKTRDTRIVATMMQWLGTGVGMGFLHDALRRAGLQIVRIPGAKT